MGEGASLLSNGGSRPRKGGGAGKRSGACKLKRSSAPNAVASREISRRIRENACSGGCIRTWSNHTGEPASACGPQPAEPRPASAGRRDSAPNVSAVHGRRHCIAGKGPQQTSAKPTAAHTVLQKSTVYSVQCTPPGQNVGLIGIASELGHDFILRSWGPQNLSLGSKQRLRSICRPFTIDSVGMSSGSHSAWRH